MFDGNISSDTSNSISVAPRVNKGPSAGMLVHRGGKAATRGGRGRRGGRGGGSVKRGAHTNPTAKAHSQKRPKRAAKTRALPTATRYTGLLPVPGVPEARLTNEAQAVRDALSDHETVKFIGRDCRALEKGYHVLLNALNENAEQYMVRLQHTNEHLLAQQRAVSVALEKLQEDLEAVHENDDDYAGNDLETRVAANEERRNALEVELDALTDKMRVATEEGYTPPLHGSVCHL